MVKLKILNKKQVLVICTSLILVIIAYVTYTNNEIDVSNQIADIENYAETLGDVQLVSSQNVYTEENVIENTISDDNNTITNELNLEAEYNTENEGREVGESNYFEETRLERDKMYSETLEIYENILSNDGISGEQKLIAENEITAITNVKNGILVAENLIKVKGFEDVVIFINDGIATVIVKSNELEKEHIAQIQNIIIKQLNIEIENISITNREE